MRCVINLITLHLTLLISHHFIRGVRVRCRVIRLIS
jgi:hypothetical protein